MTLRDLGAATERAEGDWTARKVCLSAFGVSVVGLLVGAGHEPRHAVLPLLSALAFLAAGAGFLVRWRIAGHTGRQLGVSLVVLGLHLPAGYAVQAVSAGRSSTPGDAEALSFVATAAELAVVAIAAVLARSAFTGSALPRGVPGAGVVGVLLGITALATLGVPSVALAQDLLAVGFVVTGAWWAAVAVAAWRTDVPGYASSESGRWLAATAVTIGLVTGMHGVAGVLPGSAITVDLLSDLGLLAAAAIAARVALQGLTDVLTGQERYVAALLQELAGHERHLQQTRACLHDARAAVAGIRAGSSVARHPAVRGDAHARAAMEQAVNAELQRLERLLHLPERTPVADVVDLDTVLRPLVVTHRARGLRLSWSPAGPLRVLVAGDVLAVIVGNLLGNVLRHCPGATCDLTVRVTDELTVTVRDDGPGLPAGYRARPFDAGARHGASSGEGIGLVISRDLARRHGGDLTMLDTDRGAVFQLTLPARAVDTSVLVPQPRSVPTDEMVRLRLAG